MASEGSKLSEILITDLLTSRSPRQPQLGAENQVLCTLARQLVAQPQTVLDTLVTLATELCAIESVGISVLDTPYFETTEVFRWEAIAGPLQDYKLTLHRHHSPCGVCVDRQQPHLWAKPERYFTALQRISPAIVECLTVPLVVDQRPLGVLWLVSHQPSRPIDSEDLRLATHLADFAAAALLNRQSQQQTESALRCRELELSIVTNSVPVLISFVDSEQRYRFNNRTYEEWFGCMASEVYGKTLWQVLGQTAYEAIRPYVQRVLQGEQVTFEGDIPYQNGGTRYIQATYVPRFEGQTVKGFVALVSDISDRKQADAALRQSEERLRIAQYAANAGMWDWDIVTNQVVWSKEYYELFGLDAALVQPSYENWLASVHPGDRDWVDGAAQLALAQQVDLNIEFRVLHPSQGERWILAVGKTFYDAQQPIRMTGIALDVTDRKRTELEREQLLERERNYMEQLQGLTTMALALSPGLSMDQVLTMMTEQAAAIIGAHQSVTSLTDAQNWTQAIHSVYLSDKYAQWRNYAEKPTGEGIYRQVCALNRPMRMTQAQLEADPRWQGFSHQKRHHPPLRGWLAAPLVGRDGQNIGLIQLSDKREGEFTEADEAMLMQLAQMTSVAVENARLYQAEQRARQMAEAAREEAQRANRIKDEFLAVLSHELRSPLNPILGWSKLLQTGRLGPDKVNQALAIIERNAKLQADLIEDLLDVSRILRGKLSLKLTPIDLVDTIQAAMETVGLAAEAKSIQLTLTVRGRELGEGPVPRLRIQGDAARIQQVIWNLLSNAVKFTPDHGQVAIAVTAIAAPSLPLGGAGAEDVLAPAYAQITVTDTGKGIDPDFLSHVFDYFRQADSATTRQFGGLGLGLAIVKHLVELHGGYIQADSQGVNQGATFTVAFPLLSSSELPFEGSGSGHPLAAVQAQQSLAGLNLLMVDDNQDACDYVVCLLEQTGAKVTVATSAQDALICLQQTTIDVLLSDIGMPDIDGCMLLQQLRSRPPDQGGTIPAIAITAYADEASQQRVLAAGFQRHIPKPVDPQALITAIATLADRPSAPNSGA
jgi:PAS domain S-box-containing protein